MFEALTCFSSPCGTTVRPKEKGLKSLGIRNKQLTNLSEVNNEKMMESTALGAMSIESADG